MSESSETDSLRRGIRTDLVIAVCALLISTLATAASFWQSRVVAQQLSAQVWPYLSFSTTYDPRFVAFEVVNDGLGPAIIYSTVITVDGKPYASPPQALKALLGHVPGRVMSQLSGLSPGSVIRAGSSVRLFRLDAPGIARVFGGAANRVELRVCYCSLLGNCWLVSSRSQPYQPQPVSSCPDVGADQYRVVPLSGG